MAGSATVPASASGAELRSDAIARRCSSSASRVWASAFSASSRACASAVCARRLSASSSMVTMICRRACARCASSVWAFTKDGKTAITTASTNARPVTTQNVTEHLHN